MAFKILLKRTIMKSCQFCFGEIHEKATACSHCGKRQLTPEMRAARRARIAQRRKGEILLSSGLGYIVLFLIAWAAHGIWDVSFFVIVSIAAIIVLGNLYLVYNEIKKLKKHVQTLNDTELYEKYYDSLSYKDLSSKDKQSLDIHAIRKRTSMYWTWPFMFIWRYSILWFCVFLLLILTNPTNTDFIDYLYEEHKVEAELSAAIRRVRILGLASEFRLFD